MIVQFSETAIKSLIGIDKTNAKRLKDRINKFIETPQSCNFKKLKGYNNRYRIRQGNYRIICDFRESEVKILYIIDIKHRKEAYQK